MELLGYYESPFVRRVGVTLHLYGVPFVHSPLATGRDAAAIRAANPLGRIPALVLDDGEVLIDSAAILDWLDETVGPKRALLPPNGAARRSALRRIALANGAVDKIGGGANYEKLIRPSRYRWPEWIERCIKQGVGAVAALEAESWPDDAPIDQAQITTGCALDYIDLTAPELMPAGRYRALDGLMQRLRARPEFQATAWTSYAVPRAD